MNKRIFKLVMTFSFLFTSVFAQQDKVITFDDTSIQKEVLYSKDNSVKSYWLQIRSLYSAKEQNFVDSWVLLNENKNWPQTKIISLNKKNNILRVLVSDEKLTNNIEFNTTPSNFVKLNGDLIENKKSQDIEKILNHLKASDNLSAISNLDLAKSKLRLTSAEFKELSNENKIIYYLHKRKLFEMSYAIIQNKTVAKESGKKFSFIKLFIEPFIETCQAAIESQCLTSGGLTSLTDKGRCDDKLVQIPKEFMQYSNCSQEQTLCHPLFYGLSANGKAICADRGVSCSQVSPLNSQQDLQRIMQSLKKVNIEKQQVSQKMDDYINEATKVCQQSEPSKKCDALLARRAQFNSLMVDFEQRKNNSPPRMAKDSSWPPAGKDQFEDSRLDQSKDDSCNWWCRNKTWATPVAIVAATLATTVSICKFTQYSFFGICSKNKDKSTTSTTSSDSSSVISSPVAPSSADYTSVQ